MRNYLTIIILLFCGFTQVAAQKSSVFKAHENVQTAEKYKTYLNFGEAIYHYEVAINIFTENYDETHPLVTVNYAALGEVYLNIGDLEKAKLYCNSGLENSEKRLPDSAIAVTCLECLALIAQTEKNYESALIYYQKAQQIQRKLWGDNHFVSSKLYLYLGYFYLEQQQFQQSKRYFEKVKKINETEQEFTLEFELENYLAQYYLALGRWHFEQNDLNNAALNFNKSLIIYQKINGDFHPTIAEVHLMLAKVFYQKDNLEQAFSEYDLAYSSFQDYSKKEFQIEGYDTCHCNSILLEATVGKALVLEEKYIQNQNIENLKKALNYYQRATQKVNASVKYFAKDALHRQQIIHQNKNTFTTAVRISHQLFEVTNDNFYIQKGFEFVNNYKALTLQIEQKQEQILRSDIPEKVIEEQNNWQRKITNLQFEIYVAETDNLPVLATKKQELLNAMMGQAEFLKDFKNNYWDVKERVFDDNLIDFQIIPSLLNEETVLLNYIFDKSKNQLFVFSFTRSETGFHKVNIPSNFSKNIEKLHRLLQSSLLARADKKEKFINQSNELYQYLIEPLTAILANKKRLIIIRDDVLNLLPFDILLKNNLAANFQNLAYLVKDFEIVYHYSTGLWNNSQQQKWQGKQNSLLAFAPVFDDFNHPDLTMTDDAFRCFIQDEIQVALPYSEKEVTEIQKVLGSSNENVVLLRANASKNKLIKNLKTSHRFVHIASHSFANYDNSQFSGIACFTNNKTATDYSILYISEIENLNIQSDLVVLSSCESGIGQLLNGEGLLGINRSFLYAGVPNTLFSLWKVQDEATATLMIEFYKNIQKDMDYVQALQQAKLSLLQNSRTAIPNFWASFILMGR